MRRHLVILALAALPACGLETASTAATGAAIKKQEIEAGKKTQAQVQQNLEQSMQQAQQRAREDAER